MLQSLYTAIAGMRAQQYKIDVIGNNVANISTVSFKGSRADFADTLYALMKPQQHASGTLQNGTGMMVGATTAILTQGVYNATGSKLDFLLDGAGFFTLADPEGRLCYTRDGSFRVSEVGGAGYLVTAEGYYVLGPDNQPIRMPAGTSELSADEQGGLYANGARFAQLGITAFPNPEGLIDAGGNRYLASEASGAAGAAAGAVVRQGWLEGSNVDLSVEIARLMEAQRAYSVLGTAIRAVDEMESTANRMGE